MGEGLLLPFVGIGLCQGINPISSSKAPALCPPPLPYHEMEPVGARAGRCQGCRVGGCRGCGAGRASAVLTPKTTLLGMKSQLETEPRSPRPGQLSERAGSKPALRAPRSKTRRLCGQEVPREGEGRQPCLHTGRAEELRAERISPFAGTCWRLQHRDGEWRMPKHGDQPGDPKDLGDLRRLRRPRLQPTSRWAAGFAEGHRLLPWGCARSRVPGGTGLPRRTEGTCG